MSMVTQIRDGYEERRQKTAREEARIDVEGEFAKWHRSDATRFRRPRQVLALAVLSPVLAVWFLIAVGLFLAMAINVGLYAAFGRALEGFASPRSSTKKRGQPRRNLPIRTHARAPA